MIDFTSDGTIFKQFAEFKNQDCNNALIKIFPKINLLTINDIIDKTPYITDIRKEFYKKIIELRYNYILKINYEKLIN